jgi:Tol biopolymer transport system component
MPLPVETHLGPYEILAAVGAGGMGEVYRARDTRLGRVVAIKVLSDDVSADPARRQRFEHEARTAGSLNHPNLLTVFDVGSENGASYLVTEFVEGESLRALINRGPVSARRIAEMGAQIAAGLAAAHAADIIHRDLKPDNIMLDRDGRIRILDFGLAKIRSRAAARTDANETDTTPLTDPGTVMGTVVYMSPEQVRGAEVDPRSDIFSLGIVLYELAAGKRPFLKPTSVETMTAILREDIETFPENLGALEAIVRRCLEKDPARRFQSAADLAFSLHNRSSGSVAVPALPQPAIPRSRWKLLAAAATLAALAAGAFFAGRSTAPEKLPPWTVRPLTAYPGREIDPALSPDGSQIAFVWSADSAGQAGIYVRLVDSEPPLRVSAGAGTKPCWSPDGKRIAFLRGNEILVVPALGGPERRIAEFPAGNRPNNFNLSWSPDGNWIAASTQRGLSAVRVQTGEIRDWLPSPDIRYLAFSPDGKQIAFEKGPRFSQFLYTLAVAGGSPSGEARRISPREFYSGGLVWKADGKSLIVSAALGSRFYLWSVDAGTGAARPLPIESSAAYYPAISHSSGRLAYARVELDSNIWRSDLAGSGFSDPRPFIHSTAVESDIQFCPDGKHIVFDSLRTGETAIWRSDADGSDQIPIARLDETRVGSPRCSPDGRWVVFDGYHDGNSDLYLVSAEGGEPKRLTKTPWDEFRPVFSADGKWILFGSRRNDKDELWKMPAAGGEPVQVTHGGAYEAFPSPDGKVIYFTRTSSGLGKGLWSIPVEGGAPVQVADFGVTSLWSVAGANLYWAAVPRAGQPGHISVLNPATGESRKLIALSPEFPVSSGGTSLTVSPDEKSVLFVRYDREDADLMLVENFR